MYCGSSHIRAEICSFVLAGRLLEEKLIYTSISFGFHDPMIITVSICTKLPLSGAKVIVCRTAVD